MIKEQRGVTLIELIISMVLGLALVAGIGQLFIQSQKSFRLQRNLSDMTDDATFVLEALAKGVYQAGASVDGKTNFLSDDLLVLSSTSLKFLNAQCDPTQLTPPVPSPMANTTKCEYIKGTDNEFIYRFKFYSVEQINTFICNSLLTYAVGDIVTVRIYKALDSSTPQIPVFYCKVKQTSGTAKNAEPLISDVEKLEFRYVIHDGNNFYITAAANVTDWKKVVAVKVYLVLRSADDNLTRNNASYEIDGVTTTASDHRLYKVFTKTIKLRSIDN